VSDSQTLSRRVSSRWQWRNGAMQLGSRTRIMGIVNITPDSFSDGGQFQNPDRAADHALRLLDEGADVLDLGAESTRPGSYAGDTDTATVSASQEQDRLLPVLEKIMASFPDALISVDTYKAVTARAAIAAGAQIVNDVSGLTWDRAMAATCAELRCGVVLMHTRGKPDAWKTQPPLKHEEVLPLVREGLSVSLTTAIDAGISNDAIVLDPGYGFGKRLDENYALLAKQSELLTLGRPLLAGLSRKSFLSRTLAHTQSPEAFLLDEKQASRSRETASIAAIVASILAGASIVRVHSVRSAIEAAAIADAVLAAGDCA
jgi:dihydropteroate synthase